MSETSTPCATFYDDTISGFCFPPRSAPARARAYKVTLLVLGVLVTPYREAPCTNFHDLYVKWRRFAQGCALLGSRKQHFTFRPHSPPPKKKLKFLANF